MCIIRWILGKSILFFDLVYAPKGIQRDAEVLEKIDEQTTGLSLDQYATCLLRVKVCRAMNRNTLNIQAQNTKHFEIRRNELIGWGGKLKIFFPGIDEEGSGERCIYEPSLMFA